MLQILSTSTARFKYCGSALSLIQISHFRMRCELCLSHFLRDSKPFCFKELEGICETQRNDGSWIEKSQELKKLKSNLRIPSALHISFAPFTLEEKNPTCVRRVRRGFQRFERLGSGGWGVKVSQSPRTLFRVFLVVSASIGSHRSYHCAHPKREDRICELFFLKKNFVSKKIGS